MDIFCSKANGTSGQYPKSSRKNHFKKAAKLTLARQSPLYLSIDDTVIEQKAHPHRSSGLWKEPAGTILIWQGNRYSDTKYLALTSAQAMFPFASVCAAAVRKTVLKLTGQFSFWTACWKQILMSSSRWIAGIHAKPCGTKQPKSITLIGAMKTIRFLYLDGHHCSALDYVAKFPNDQYHLVTVGGHEYWIHRYEGGLNGIDKAVVLLFYTKNAFCNKNALHVFICSDLKLSDAEILTHYMHRWNIGGMFKQHKM